MKTIGRGGPDEELMKLGEERGFKPYYSRFGVEEEPLLDYHISISIENFGFYVPLQGGYSDSKVFESVEDYIKSLDDRDVENLLEQFMDDFFIYYKSFSRSGDMGEGVGIEVLKKYEDKVRNEVIKVLSGDYWFDCDCGSDPACCYRKIKIWCYRESHTDKELE